MPAQKTWHLRTGPHAPRWWLSSARWAVRSAPLTGRFFAANHGEARQAGEATRESFDEPFENPFRADNYKESAPSIDPPATPRNTACDESIVRKSDRSNRERVVLFAPGPITEDDLLRENLKRAATIRQRRWRRRRFRWLTDNAGTIVFVMGMLVLAWLVAAT